MPIQVDEAYLRHVIDILNNQISTEVVASPGGPIESVKVLAGYALPTGESVESSVTSQGSSVHSLLAALGNLSSTRAAQLGQFITLTGQTEDYASMTAAEFGQQLPGWVPGGSSSGNSA